MQSVVCGTELMYNEVVKMKCVGGGKGSLRSAPLSNLEGLKKMTIDEKAMMILEGMETYMQIDWNLEELYIKAIKVGLMEIEKKEKEEGKQ